MGKPYLTEIKMLPETYQWAMMQPIAPLIDAVGCCASLPLIVTGSGGSLTAAALVASLHQRCTGNLAKSVTPLELVYSLRGQGDSAIMVLSAGGSNPDILAVLKQVIASEPRRIIVVCSRRDSPLVQIASRYPYISLFFFDLPTGADGFLATNSLLAFLVLLGRAYGSAFQLEERLPKTYSALLHPGETCARFSRNLKGACAQLWQRDYLVLLHGDATRPGAVDLESKFSEAALGAIIPSDYRNFAHGRHHWLAKRGDRSGVIALHGIEERSLAHKTINLLPETVPTLSLAFNLGHLGTSIASVAIAMEVVGFFGAARNLDPGRPGVPLFGRKIYNLRGFPGAGKEHRSREELAIWRKTGFETSKLSKPELTTWQDAYHSFLNRITKQFRYESLALDFDETLCDSKDRMIGVQDQAAGALTRLLQDGIIVGIATGRGRSVRESLRSKIPKELWSKVLVGYYNGSEIGSLAEDHFPRSRQVAGKEFGPLLENFKNYPLLSRLAEWECREVQITVRPKVGVKFLLVWETLQQIVHDLKEPKLPLVRSGHSIDILRPGASKRKLVDALRQQLKKQSSEVLCIGDKGRWPGNDFALLSERASLSVDECSFDPNTCWNLCPSGYRGTKATVFYLKALAAGKNGAALRIR